MAVSPLSWTATGERETLRGQDTPAPGHGGQGFGLPLSQGVGWKADGLLEINFKESLLSDQYNYADCWFYTALVKKK